MANYLLKNHNNLIKVLLSQYIRQKYKLLSVIK